MGFHLLRLLYLYDSRVRSYVHARRIHIAWAPSQAGKEPRRDSWNSRGRLEVKAIALRRSRVLFLLQACPRKVGRPREELIIRYEPSGWTSSASDEKWKTKRMRGERDWKGNGLKENEKRRWKRGRRQRVEKKEQKRILTLLDADLFYFVSPNSPDSRCKISTSQTEAHEMLSG